MKGTLLWRKACNSLQELRMMAGVPCGHWGAQGLLAPAPLAWGDDAPRGIAVTPTTIPVASMRQRRLDWRVQCPRAFNATSNIFVAR
jgi:hypothetical protein